MWELNLIIKISHLSESIICHSNRVEGFYKCFSPQRPFERPFSDLLGQYFRRMRTLDAFGCALLPREPDPKRPCAFFFKSCVKMFFLCIKYWLMA